MLKARLTGGRRAGVWRVLLVLFVATATACQEEGIRVEALEFDGNRAFADDALRAAIVTRAPGWLPFTRRQIFDPVVFEADLERLRAFYVDRGFPDARVTAEDVALNDDNTEVRLRIGIDEGAPLRLERIVATGLEALDAALAAEVRAILPEAAGPRDREAVAALRDRVAFLLRDRGYPRPQVNVREEAGTTPDATVVTFEIDPGQAATFGPTSISPLLGVQERVVRRTLTYAPGDLYRESEVLESQRRLQSLGLFSFAHVAPADGEAPAGDPAAPVTNGGPVAMRVTVTERKPTQLQVGIGYGTEEGPRGSFEWRHLNLMGAARQFSTQGRYSGRLRGLATEYTEPWFLMRGLSLVGSTAAWWTDEPQYTARTFGGRVGVSYRREVSRGLRAQPSEHILRVIYINETQRYRIDPETLADLTQFDELVALGFDPVTGSGRGRLAAIEIDGERIEVDTPIDPSRGYVLHAHFQQAAPALGGTFRFTELGAEARGYLPAGRTVVAARLRVNAIRARVADDVPFSSRYFLGGSSSLRGWGRLEVAPLTVDGLPIGGLSVVETSAELRFPIVGRLGGVVFVDAGNVWDTATGIEPGDLAVNVGPGLRYTSLVGVVRADVGIQLTRIPGLLVNGEPERRRWRIHFSIGHAF